MALTDDETTAAWQAMRTVVDPELAIDIVAMGLVYDIREEDGEVVAEITLTTPGCPVADSLPAEAARALGAALPARRSRVQVVWEPQWTPEMIEPEAAQALGIKF